MKLSSRAAALAVALCCCEFARAQVAHPGQPLGLAQHFATSAPLVLVPAPDVEAYRAEDEERGHRPLRYGAVVDVALDLSDGAWSTLADGSRVWRLELASPGALSLAVEFGRFDLPRGASLYVYDAAVERWLGAYTSENRHPDGGFVFEPFPGERLTLELDVPAGAATPRLDLRSVIHDYRGVLGLMSAGPGGGATNPGEACMIDVNCPQGDPFGLQKRAALRTLSHGQLCSGALINNTGDDGTGYVLTAEHCTAGTDCVFLFNYQTPQCGAGIAPTNQSITGCSVLSTSVPTDCRLLRIDTPIPPAYRPYFAGWNRTNVNATFAFTMGHPWGLPKKIAIDADGTVIQTVIGNSYWAVTWSAGYVQAGSSGGALFDEAGRIRGPASLAQYFEPSCFENAWFARLDLFWAANPVAQWLDPLGTGPTILDGYDPHPCLPVQNICTSAPNSVGPGAVIAWSGSQSHPANDFHLVTHGCPPGVTALYFCGDTQTLVPFGNGFRCVASPLVRLPVTNADAQGQVTWNLDLGGMRIHAGETWMFQLWYRDPNGGGALFNASDALAVPFCY